MVSVDEPRRMERVEDRDALFLDFRTVPNEHLFLLHIYNYREQSFRVHLRHPVSRSFPSFPSRIARAIVATRDWQTYFFRERWRLFTAFTIPSINSHFFEWNFKGNPRCEYSNKRFPRNARVGNSSTISFSRLRSILLKGGRAFKRKSFLIENERIVHLNLYKDIWLKGPLGRRSNILATRDTLLPRVEHSVDIKNELFDIGP